MGGCRGWRKPPGAEGLPLAARPWICFGLRPPPLFDVASLPCFLFLGSASEPTLFRMFPPRSWGLASWCFARALGFEDTMPIPATGGRVSPISTSELSVPAGALAARLPAGMRVVQFQVGAGFDIISHAHSAR